MISSVRKARKPRPVSIIELQENGSNATTRMYHEILEHLSLGIIILEVNGQKVDGNNTLADLLKDKHPGDQITLRIYHKDGEKNVSVTLGEAK